MITHEIVGDDMQAVVLTLGGGDVVRAEAGALMSMTDAIEMDAKLEGGLLGGLKRKLLAGESLFITYFPSNAAGAKLAFAGRLAQGSLAAKGSSSRRWKAPGISSFTAAAPSSRSSSGRASG